MSKVDEAEAIEELRKRLQGPGDPKARKKQSKSWWEKMNFVEELRDEKLITYDHLGKLDNDTLRRFLAARKYNLKKAENMVRDWARWRALNKVDEILPPDGKIRKDSNDILFEAMIQSATVCTDKKGRPVYWERTGKMDLGTILKYCTEDDLVRRYVRNMEVTRKELVEASTKKLENLLLDQKYLSRGRSNIAQSIAEYTAPDFTKQVAIFDLAGLDKIPKGPVLKLMKRCMGIGQAFYPERLGRAILLNAPGTFQVLWKLLSPFLDKVTKKKISVLGKKKYLKVLMEDISSEYIPTEYGGAGKLPSGLVEASSEKRKELIAKYEAEIAQEGK